ncbi:hypothetical protein VRK_29670 [Vibrio sp. MEBiC08052]|nr:hypothetical protein VRK_29670 [Vibrio sp. MEBiC08052]
MQTNIAQNKWHHCKHCLHRMKGKAIFMMIRHSISLKCEGKHNQE